MRVGEAACDGMGEAADAAEGRTCASCASAATNACTADAAGVSATRDTRTAVAAAAAGPAAADSASRTAAPVEAAGEAVVVADAVQQELCDADSPQPPATSVPLTKTHLERLGAPTPLTMECPLRSTVSHSC